MLNVASHINFDFCPFGLAFSPDLKILAIGGDEPTVKLNHTRTGGPCTQQMWLRPSCLQWDALSQSGAECLWPFLPDPLVSSKT